MDNIFGSLFSDDINLRKDFFEEYIDVKESEFQVFTTDMMSVEEVITNPVYTVDYGTDLITYIIQCNKPIIKDKSVFYFDKPTDCLNILLEFKQPTEYSSLISTKLEFNFERLQNGALSIDYDKEITSRIEPPNDKHLEWQVIITAYGKGSEYVYRGKFV